MCRIVGLAEDTTTDPFGLSNVGPVVTWVITIGSFGIIVIFSARMCQAQRKAQWSEQLG